VNGGRLASAVPRALLPPNAIEHPQYVIRLVISFYFLLDGFQIHLPLGSPDAYEENSNLALNQCPRVPTRREFGLGQPIVIDALH